MLVKVAPGGLYWDYHIGKNLMKTFQSKIFIENLEYISSSALDCSICITNVLEIPQFCKKLYFPSDQEDSGSPWLVTS